MHGRPGRSRPPAPGLNLGEGYDVLRLIWALDHGLHVTSRRMETRLGLTGPQRLVVRLVGRFPGIPSGELAGLLHVDPSTLTGLVSRLERRGLVARRSDPRDRRRVLLGLTPQGRALDLPASGTVEAAVGRALHSLAPEKVEAAREVLSVLTQSLEEPDA
jgi:DNA-binding MarR family transcriptional regulator